MLGRIQCWYQESYLEICAGCRGRNVRVCEEVRRGVLYNIEILLWYFFCLEPKSAELAL